MKVEYQSLTDHHTQEGIKRKALVLAYYFPPLGLSGVQRTLKFVKYMPMFGWEPTVVTTGPTAYYAHDQSLQHEAEGLGVRILRTSGTEINARLAKGRSHTMQMPSEWLRRAASYVSGALYIPDNKISWAKQAYSVARSLLQRERFDVIFVSVPPFSTALMAAQLRMESSTPLVLDYRDLWYGNQFMRYPSLYHAEKHKKLERSVLKVADRVIVTNRRMKEKILHHYPDVMSFDRISMIPHGFDPQDMERTPLQKNNKKFWLTYAGIFYDFVTPEYFLKAFAQIKHQFPDIAFDTELHFVGHFRKENRALVRSLGVERHVFDHGYQNHDDTLDILQMSDALWMMVGYAKNADTISSGKLYEYFGTRKPILASLPEGALRQSAERYGASLLTSPDDVEAIRTAILTLYDQYKRGRLPQPHHTVVEEYRRDILTESLTQELYRAMTLV
jgi:glycosyltransferase involved in cell wall biosynthesis